MTLTSLRHIDNDQDCIACYAVMLELRPNLIGPDAFVAQLRRQREQGYRLLAAWQGEEIVALAGYRFQENLLYGRFVYIDDLVVGAGARSQGLGRRLIEAVREEAKRLRCDRLVLDTGLSNALAQRFYFRQGLLATGLHFVEAVD
jgi:ribosomal protein S18 acetylase RimI-like enzyme